MRKKIKCISLILIAIICFSFLIQYAYGTNDSDMKVKMKNITALYINSSSAFVNGTQKVTDSKDSTIAPFIMLNKEFVPLRFIMENYGAVIKTGIEKGSVLINLKGKQVKIKKDDDKMYVNGKSISMGQSAILRNGRFFIPIDMAASILEMSFSVYDRLIIIGNNDNEVNDIKEELLEGIKGLFASSILDDSALFQINVNDKVGFINKGGKVIIEPQFVSTRGFSEGLANVIYYEYGNKTQVKNGYIDKTGKVIIQLQDNCAGLNFSEGLAAITIATETIGKQKYGYIDKTGQIVISPIYDMASNFNEGLARVNLNGKYVFIDMKGNLAFNSDYNATVFSEGFAIIGTDDKYGYINNKGQVIIEPKFDLANSFSNGMALVRIGSDADGKFGYINKSGKLVIKAKFDNAYDFSDDLALVRMNKKVGYIDKNGNYVIKPKFIEGSSFSDGLAKVINSSDGFGYIDKTGTYVIKPRFSYGGNFENGLALVYEGKGIGSTIGYINKTGKYVWKMKVTS